MPSARPRSGLILIATVNNNGAGQRVAPPGGIEPRLGTNPLCAAVPTDRRPVVLDFGTSVVAEGKVRVYHINKRPVPEGWLLDPEGSPTTDPAVLYKPPLGSILPMGGAQAYKGFGLGLVLDMLAGGLSGGTVEPPRAPRRRKGNNVLFLALDPARFAGRDALLREVDRAGRVRPRRPPGPRASRRSSCPATPSDAPSDPARPRESRWRETTGPCSLNSRSGSASIRPRWQSINRWGPASARACARLIAFNRFKRK